MIDTIYSDPNFLQHYGVKGMKWGVRKEEYKTAKRNRRTARKNYNKAYNKAYNFSTSHPISQFIKKSKNYKKSDDLWDEAIQAAKKSRQANEDFANVKSTYKRDKKIAKTSYNTAYETAYDFSVAHPISQHIKSSSNYKISNALWSDASRLGEEYVKNYGLLGITWEAPVKKSIETK